MRNRLALLLNTSLNVCRYTEVRGLFLVGYLLLLMWPFFTQDTPSLWQLYHYYHSIWGILIFGLAIQGYWVLTDDTRSEGDKDD